MEKKKYAPPEISREELQQQLYLANIQLSEANERLRQEERMRTEMFANLSHDLRAPLTALASAVEYLSGGALEPEEQKKTLRMMQRRMEFLRHLVEDMFLLAKMESADTPLQLQTLDAGAFLEEFFTSCEVDSAYDNRRLKLLLPDGLNCSVRIDPERIVRVLDNLFTNARKYSREGDSITLSAEQEGDMLAICVSDTGIGIPEEQLPHIFERTYRSTKARTPGDDSSGLGLAIAQKIVERHGGTITVRSTPGCGSTFCFTIPLKKF